MYVPSAAAHGGSVETTVGRFPTIDSTARRPVIVARLTRELKRRASIAIVNRPTTRAARRRGLQILPPRDAAPGGPPDII